MSQISDPSVITVFLVAQAIYVACAALLEKIVSEIYQPGDSVKNYKYSNPEAMDLRQKTYDFYQHAIWHYLFVFLLAFTYMCYVAFYPPDLQIYKYYLSVAFSIVIMITFPFVVHKSLSLFLKYIHLRDNKVMGRVA